ncbi:MAG: Eco57I restriction-modification methylase domain-containing protein [Sulfuriferula sp.]
MFQQQLEHVINADSHVAPFVANKRKAELGQFMTPSSVAGFMASLFPPSTLKTCRLLDAGAGMGALSCAFLDRWISGGFGFEKVETFAYEIDNSLREHLTYNLANYQDIQSHIISGDFIQMVTAAGLDGKGYTHAILNPPYKKINSRSAHRLALRTVGIETVNLYSAFVALAVALAIPGGQIVAIIPRSFCNGPYYRAFRDFMLERASLQHIHLFESRNKAFKEDKVLQENVIIRLEKGGKQGPVTISTSTDDTFTDLVTHHYPFERIVFPDDTERFIHVPTSPDKSTIELSPSIRYSLSDIGIKVSTGPVVDFRLKGHLRDMPEKGTIPLLYPAHFNNSGIEWPKMGMKKPNAIQRNIDTEKWFYPNGFYCVVRRFSAKEEKRRIVASVVNPAAFGDAAVLGFENHLNLFHENKNGLPQELATGLAVFLNTTAIDESFRRFNGHTQVNATDLKQMRYPNRDVLIQLGKWAMKYDDLTQVMIDEQFGTITA